MTVELSKLGRFEEAVAEFQKAEVMVAPALQTEGKYLQQAQGVGMAHR